MIMKKMILSGIFFAAFTGLSFGQSANDLPKNASDFINQHFSSETIKEVDKKDGIEGYFNDELYEVEFTNGTSIDIDENGEVTEIETKNGTSIPKEALPNQVRSYIESNHSNAQIVSWEKEDDEQEVKLADGTELEFDGSGKFLRID